MGITNYPRASLGTHENHQVSTCTVTLTLTFSGLPGAYPVSVTTYLHPNERTAEHKMRPISSWTFPWLNPRPSIRLTPSEFCEQVWTVNHEAADEPPSTCLLLVSEFKQVRRAVGKNATRH